MRTQYFENLAIFNIIVKFNAHHFNYALVLNNSYNMELLTFFELKDRLTDSSGTWVILRKERRLPTKKMITKLRHYNLHQRM